MSSSTVTTSGSRSHRNPPFQFLNRLYDSIDLWQYLLPYCDMKTMASLHHCLARRDTLRFVQCIRELHTGYFNLWPLHSPNCTSWFKEFMMKYIKEIKDSPETVSKIQHLALFARGFPNGFPFSPLTFCNSLLMFWGLTEFMASAPLSSLQCLSVDVIDDGPTHLIQKVSLSKSFITRLQQQLSSGHLAKLVTLSLCSPYSNVEDVSILELIRCNCPLLERMDVQLNFTVEDFQMFADPSKIWPSLKELEVGNLIERFLVKLEMDDYFQNQFTDAEELVMLSITAALTAEKFPRLKGLEVLSPHSEFTFSFFKALVQQWSDGIRYEHIKREGHFVGSQLSSFVFAQPEDSRSSQSAWSNQWTNIFKQNKMFTKLSDPTLNRYCLFPSIDQLKFYGDIPSPYLMLLFNCGIGSNVISKAFQLHVFSKCWVSLSSFLEHFHQLDRWKIEDLHFSSPLEIHSSAKRRSVFNVRGYSDVIFVNEDGQVLPSNTALVGETIRQQLQSNDGYGSDDEYLHEEVESSCARFLEATLWGKLESLQILGIHQKMLNSIVPWILSCNNFRDLLPTLTEAVVYFDETSTAIGEITLQFLTACVLWNISRIRFEVHSHAAFQAMKLLVEQWRSTLENIHHIHFLMTFDRESWRL